MKRYTQVSHYRYDVRSLRVSTGADAIRMMAIEKHLDELMPELREQFEEHFSDC